MTLALAMALLAQDAGALMRAADARLSVPCEGEGECAAAPPDARFRIEQDDAGAIGAKERAIRDTGARCSVVGARVCTRPPRTLFSTPVDR